MLTMMCGLPGSGKSTLARSLGGTVVSTDAIRAFLTGNEDDLSQDPLVFSIAREMIRYYLAAGRHVIYDATNLRRAHRKKVLTWAKGYPVEVIWVDTPWEEALQRNRRRQRQVPEEVICRLARLFQPPSEKEGFTLKRVNPEP